jgi:hypothetical protein
VYVPLDDERLDFIMGSWANDMKNKIKHISANAGYYDLPR